MQDPTREFYETQADEYERQTKGFPPRELFDGFIARLPTGGAVLDLGCAYGRESARFVEKGFKVTGIDYSSSLIYKAKRAVPSAIFLVEDIRKMKPAPLLYDGVWAYMCLLHLKKAEIPAVLKRISSALKTGGILGIGVKLGEGEGFMRDKRYDGAQKFFSYFGEDELKRMLDDAGFEVLQSDIRGQMPPYQEYPLIEILAEKR